MLREFLEGVHHGMAFLGAITPVLVVVMIATAIAAVVHTGLDHLQRKAGGKWDKMSSLCPECGDLEEGEVYIVCYPGKDDWHTAMWKNGAWFTVPDDDDPAWDKPVEVSHVFNLKLPK